MLIRAGLAGGMIVLAGILAAPTAQANIGPGDDKPTPTTSGNTVRVTVTGTGVRGGSDGSPGGVGGRTVSVPTPCSYIQSMTGKQYYEYIEGGAPLGRDAEGNPFKPYPGYEKYKDDDKGHWYGTMCSSETFDDIDEFSDFAEQWFAEHRAVFVQEHQQPPVPPIPPELLRNVAFDEMTVPTPTIDWNPKHAGDAASIVNIDTWVWLTDRRTNIFVEASVESIAGRISARVDADLTGMTVSAPTADGAECKGPGVPYAPGASGECSIKFLKASPGQSKTPVTVETNWRTTWMANGQPRGDTPDPLDPATSTTNIRVVEIQAVTR